MTAEQKRFRELSETGRVFACACAAEFAKVSIAEASEGVEGEHIAEFSFAIAVRLAELCEVES